MSLPSLAEVEHADWPTLQRVCVSLGLNPKGRSSVVRMRVLDHVRRRVRPELWRPGAPQQAALLTRLGHPDAAMRLWESSIQLDAPAPWVGLGRAQLGGGDLTEAAKSFDRAAQMGDAAANLHRAEALAAAGNFEGAVRACDTYLTARPRNLRGLLLKANFLARGGWGNEAATILRDAFESHPDVREFWRGLGTLLLQSGRADAAAEAFREAIRASPDEEGSWINRGAALLLAGQTKEAVGVLREALEKDPRQAIALNNLGVAYFRGGQTKSAAVNLERAAKHMESPQILRNLAAVQAAAHRAPATARVSRIPRAKPRAVTALRAAKPPRSLPSRVPSRSRKPRRKAREKRPKRPVVRRRRARPPPRRRPSPTRARKKTASRRRPRTRRRGPRRA